MKTFVSIAARPGTTGTYYYNKFFKSMDIDAVYKAIRCENLSETVANLKQMNLSGISVTMPFKKAVMSYLDLIDQSVIESESCNTIKIEDSKWIGYNSDINGVRWAANFIQGYSRIQLLGDGAMSRLFQIELKTQNIKFEVYSRKLGNWDGREKRYEVVINATSIGTFDASSPRNMLEGAEIVIDLSLTQGNLANYCLSTGTKYISGLEFYKQVFKRQFQIYTGVEPNEKLFDAFTREKNIS